MIYSMTGFGKSQVKQAEYQCNVEVRSLNYRHTEVRIFGIKDMLEIENDIMARVKKRFHRGKFDVHVKVQPLGLQAGLHEKQVLAHHKSLHTLAQKMGLGDSISLETVLKTLPPSARGLPARKIKKSVEIAVDVALNQLEQSRALEGNHLVADIQKRLRLMIKESKNIEKRSKTFVKRKFHLLQQKVAELVSSEQLDRGRLEMEVALVVERNDITEELVRLSSHLARFQETLQGTQEQDGIGRKLDFLIQEINREINTIGSKVADAVITNIVVQLKSELEKVREQVQNLE